MQGVKKVFGIGEEQKELVDPYFVFSFAGKDVCMNDTWKMIHIFDEIFKIHFSTKQNIL